MTPASSQIHEILAAFLSHSAFARAGAVITDLDGTALHQSEGRTFIAKPVELGLKRLYDLGRPFVLNSLRSPLSILRSFGRDWYRVSNAPIPAVTLNGSLLGYVAQTSAGEMTFEELAAFPLPPAEIDAALDRIAQMLADGGREILLLYYPRRWQSGEIVWTPAVSGLPRLRAQLHSEAICMMHLHLPSPDSFLTHAGVDKLSGAQQMAERLGFDLTSSIGAGDTAMDRFLSGVGLAVLVGEVPLEFRGRFSTLRLRDSLELGNLLFELGAMLQHGA